MDIFEHLKRDHRTASNLIDQIMTSDDGARRSELFARLKNEVLTHSRAEEANFYSVLMRYEEMEDLITEAREDHRMIEALIDEIEALPVDSEEWSTRFEELKEAIDDHVDQEETEIFDEARSVLDERQADELEQRMRQTEAPGFPPA